MSAIDLCADSVLLASGEPLKRGGKFYDLGDLRRRWGRLETPPTLRGWIEQLREHPDLALLVECRNSLTHRFVDQEYRLHVWGEPPRLRKVRTLAEIATQHGENPARWHGSIGELIPRVVGFGENQLEAICRALLETWVG